jgi:hypothetical protein
LRPDNLYREARGTHSGEFAVTVTLNAAVNFRRHQRPSLALPGRSTHFYELSSFSFCSYKIQAGLDTATTG